MRTFYASLVISFMLLLQGCATLKPLDFEDPTVTVNSVKIIPSDGIAPKFEISLHIVNPNSVALPLRGVAYSVTIDDQKILNGVSNDMPEIAAYGAGDITLSANANLLNSVRLIASLMQQNRKMVAYEMNAKLDLGTFTPNIYIKDVGEISLNPGAQ
ncbi:LEA type 2 family protein [Neptunomonas qingdaonensis]|uniref:LEA14-like dessication related protein n=1 Tax=Neptunomonas qingdaonensis TaxID=1045558 RepID=A0A1I2QTQ9_9GAMM|nr:LEA type 2 family protein [Neptunomonas qingdaonensis]SFG31734.1 LEA14-like dessication related protein [Neptunomonas qingdaonensis]